MIEVKSIIKGVKVKEIIYIVTISFFLILEYGNCDKKRRQ